MELDRRSFLKATLGGALTAGLALPLPRDLTARPAGPVREFRFSASPARISLGRGPEFIAWTYNGQVPGPEIRVREGDIVRVVLKNFLPEGTTIHWHGLPVPNAVDGVPGVTQEPVRPGETFVYEFEARPSGTFLYHSHARYQLDQGLYGALIIEPAAPAASYDREYTLLLEDWVMRDLGGVASVQRRPTMGMHGMMGMRRGTGRGRGPLLEPVYDGYAVSGRLYPETAPIKVRKGDRVKLRILNPSSSTIYDLRLSGHRLTVTHADGNPIFPTDTDVLRVGMGERYDVEFVADNPGNWLLAARERGFGEGMLRVPLRYKGVRAAEPTPPAFFRELRLAGYWDFKARHPLDVQGPEAPARSYPQTLSGGMHSRFWTINGRVYPDSERLRVRKGDRVRLLYTNHSMVPHPMHLHGHFFLVVNPSLPRNLWVLKDTVIVHPMQRVEIEFLADNPGKWFHHCHNLYHLNAGMANVIVYES